MSIENFVKALKDIMRIDEGIDGDAQRIAQIVWMLFLKVIEDKEKEWELEDDNYISPIPEELRWRNWAENDEGITGDELLDFINNELFAGLRSLSSTKEIGFLIRDMFQEAHNYMKNGVQLRKAINVVNQLDFNDADEKHAFNDIYETFLRDLQSAGDSGEFYTPRAITDFIVKVIKPKLGEKVLDMACGTGGFLVSAIEHIKQNEKVDTLKDYKKLQESILGIEKKGLPHRLCTTNLILHGIEVPKIRRDNSLSTPVNSISKNDTVEVITMNPPFGGAEEDGIMLNFDSKFRTKETADLFMVKIIKMLKENGRAAVVLPDGFLFGEGVKTEIKKELLEICNLHTVVRLPNGVFNPYTGIKTNILFFEKGSSTKEVWYFEHPYPNGYKNYSKTKPIKLDEFFLELDWWEKRTESEYAWKVSIDVIKEKKYNLDFRNPNVKDEVVDLNKEQIINKIKSNFTLGLELINQIERGFKNE